MDLPFGEVDWEEKEIRSLWSPSSPLSTSSSSSSSSSLQSGPYTASWYTANTHGRVDLTAIARDFSDSADTSIVYDRGERPKGVPVKCVIVGRRKKTAQEVDGTRLHYVLFVAQKPGGSPSSRYERIGVGAIAGSLITLLEGPGTMVQVC